MYNIKHGKRIITETYYDGVMSGTKQDVQIDIFSDHQNILKDIVESLSVITTGETKKLELEVCIDKQGRYRLKKKWSLA